MKKGKTPHFVCVVYRTNSRGERSEAWRQQCNSENWAEAFALFASKLMETARVNLRHAKEETHADAAN